MSDRTSKGTLVPEKDSPITAGLSLYLQNAVKYGSLSGGFAGIHAPAHRSDFRPHNSSTSARNDAHPSLRKGKTGAFSKIIGRWVHHYTVPKMVYHITVLEICAGLNRRLTFTHALFTKLLIAYYLHTITTNL